MELNSDPVVELVKVIGIENYIPSSMKWDELDADVLKEYFNKCLEQLPPVAKADPLFMAGLYKMYGFEQDVSNCLKRMEIEQKKLLEDSRLQRA